ncbi:SPOR domain-containing protein [Thermodesulfobacteriota bacterium]
MTKKKRPPPKMKNPAPPQKRRGLALWLGLIFFVSIWMFILGIFVGRGTAPVQFDIEKLQKELAALKAEFIKKEHDRFNNSGDRTGDKTELRFYEGLKKPRNDDKLDTEIINKPETANGVEQKTAALHVSETSVAPLKIETKVAEKKPETTALEEQQKGMPKTVDTIGTSRKGPAGVPEKGSGTGTHLTIQVASYKDPKAADTMVEDLIRKGYPAYRTIGDVPGKGTWFRVRIGTYKNRDDAGAMLVRLKKDGIKAILVRR